ncbi:hypothetical protein [Streptomyces erythrochromogenes]|uniref:hypothetical protein n=1 Tax=Streptomyces erythrochromogenes TaxID=285574 RepID=UPI00386C603B|nr:hypothetical protein OG364_29555 [Streptomyces erythrochromogenes]
MLDLDAARAYGVRTHDTDHARLLKALATLSAMAQPARPPLNLARVRAQQAAARAKAETDRRARMRAEAARRRPLAVQAAREARTEAAAARSTPTAPPGAVHAVGRDGRPCWAWIDPWLGVAAQWGRLALGLTAAGPLTSLEVRRGPCGERRGQTEIRRGDDGQLWAVVTISPDEGPVPFRTLRHEFAHVADELERLRTMGTHEAWRAEFSTTHRSGDAERFAEAAEEWLDPQMRAVDVLARARAHQDQRARWRGRGR